MICQENIETLSKSCIPIITKVAIVGEDKECDSLQYIKDTLEQQYLDFA